MKSRKQHIEISKLLLGYSTSIVHKIMDDASKRFGPGHRMFNHSPVILDFIELIYGEKARKEALLHLLIDSGIIQLK